MKIAFEWYLVRHHAITTRAAIYAARHSYVYTVVNVHHRQPWWKYAASDVFSCFAVCCRGACFRDWRFFSFFVFCQSYRKVHATCIVYCFALRRQAGTVSGLWRTPLLPLTKSTVVYKTTWPRYLVMNAVTCPKIWWKEIALKLNVPTERVLHSKHLYAFWALVTQGEHVFYSSRLHVSGCADQWISSKRPHPPKHRGMSGYMPPGPNVAVSLCIVSNAKHGLSYFWVYPQTHLSAPVKLEYFGVVCKTNCSHYNRQGRMNKSIREKIITMIWNRRCCTV